MLRTTAGQVLVNDTLPEDMQDWGRVLDKKGINELLRQVAQRHPEKYPEISKKLNDVGRTVATEFGGYSFGLEHLATSKIAQQNRIAIRAKLKTILDNDDLTPKQRNDQIIRAVGSGQQKAIDDVFDEAVAANNPLAMQVVSGSRGNKMNMATLLSGDSLYADHHDNVIPLPVLSSYSEGLKPSEYWAATYGARRGTLATKFAVRDAGYLSKQLNQINHRLMVVGDDDPRDLPMRGLPVDTDDPDNEGALLAHDVGPYKRNTVLSPKMLAHLKQLKHDRILVRSPVVGGSPDGGVYARDVGVRERGVLPGRGEMVGLTAAQALSEPLSQGQLSAKHSGGVAGQEKAVGGFKLVDQMVQVPTTFAGGATHSEHDGIIQSVDPAPAGGHHVWVNNEQHFVPRDRELKVKRGDTVEAGDVLSSGYPNPDKVVEHKGIGEGKRYFVQAFHGAMKDAGMKASRRNIELLARGLINHVQLTDEFADYVPEDVVPYSTMEHLYQPRDDRQTVATGPHAVGKYLEKPVLHYSVGTKIRPSVLKELTHFGVKDVEVHDKPPPFQPHMVRGMYSLQNDPDWMTRMYGSGLKDSLLDGTARGSTSDELGTSFVPSLTRAVDFGRIGNMQTPEAGTAPPPEGVPMPSLQPLKPTGMPKMPGMKMADDEFDLLKSAGVDSTVKPNTGSSTGGMAPVAPIKAAPGTKPPDDRTPSPTSLAKPALPATPLGIPPKQPPSPMPGSPEPQAPAPAGQVNPQRAAIMRGASGLLQPGDDPRQVSQFVAGHEDPDQFQAGRGGAFGAATRFGSLFDSDAISSLTGGKPRNTLPGQSGSLLGGAENYTPHTWGPAVPKAVPQPSGVPSTAAAGLGVVTSPLGASLAAQLPGWLGRNASKVLRVAPPLYAAMEGISGLSQTSEENRAKAEWILGDAVTGLRPDGQEPGTFGAIKHFAASPGKTVAATGQALLDSGNTAHGASDDELRMDAHAKARDRYRLEELEAKKANPATPLTPEEAAVHARLSDPLYFNTPQSFGRVGGTFGQLENMLATDSNAGQRSLLGGRAFQTDATRAGDYKHLHDTHLRQLRDEAKAKQEGAAIASAADPVVALGQAMQPQMHSTIVPSGGVPLTSQQLLTAQNAIQAMPAGPAREAASQALQKRQQDDEIGRKKALRDKNVSDEIDFRANQEFNYAVAGDRERESRTPEYYSGLRYAIRKKHEKAMEEEIAKFQSRPLSRDPGSQRPPTDHTTPFYPAVRGR